MILSDLLPLAIRAHNGTSFSPEQRGASYIKDYSAQLESDIEEIRAACAGSEYVDTDAVIARYTAGFRAKFSHWMSAKGRCISSMITGPSNFPTDRARKFNDWERSASDAFTTWRDRALKGITRQSKGPVTADSELERYEKKLAGLVKAQQLMKDANKAIKAAKGADCTAALVALGLAEDMAKKIQAPDFAGRIGFPSYALTNNNSVINDTKKRIEAMSKRKEVFSAGPKEITVNGVRVVFNAEADRIQLIHGEKPERSVIELLKVNAFRWSPSGTCWQRQLTIAGLHAAAKILNVEYNTLAKAYHA